MAVLILSLVFIGLLKNVKSYDALKNANNLLVFSVPPPLPSAFSFACASSSGNILLTASAASLFYLSSPFNG
jgi:hypothetical protein